jgi:hypothetical protein
MPAALQQPAAAKQANQPEVVGRYGSVPTSSSSRRITELRFIVNMEYGQMRYGLLASLLLLGAPISAMAQLSAGDSRNDYPQFVPVPGYPVNYAPWVDLNFFVHDGLYWVYQKDTWYSSTRYDGPWAVVDPLYVPDYVLQVPVRYYRQPPAYFRSWQLDRAPRWDDHWGRDWAQRRPNWNQPLRSATSVAPPDYQRQNPGTGYVRANQEQILHDRSFRFRPQPQLPQKQQPAQIQSAQAGPVTLAPVTASTAPRTSATQ